HAARVRAIPVNRAPLVHREQALGVAEQDLLRREWELRREPAQAADGPFGRYGRSASQTAMILALPEIEHAVHESVALAEQLLAVEARGGVGLSLLCRWWRALRCTSLCVDLRH